MVVFDIGANMGTHGIPLDTVAGETGTVVCFEPHRKTFDALVENIERNDAERVVAERLALGATSGEAELYVEEDEPGVGSHSLIRRATEIQTTEKVKILTGDEYVEANGLTPDLMKIDVEGGELSVLRGFPWTLSEHKPSLIVEVHGGVSTDEVQGLLEEYGYSLTRSTADKEIIVAK